MRALFHLLAVTLEVAALPIQGDRRLQEAGRNGPGNLTKCVGETPSELTKTIVNAFTSSFAHGMGNSSSVGAWPLVSHPTPTTSGTCDAETFINVAFPSGSSEYYIDVLPAGQTATYIASNPGAGVIFTNVAAYHLNGAPVVLSNGSFDQIIPQPDGSPISATWTGPLLILTRFYKSSGLRDTFASNQGWLPRKLMGGSVQSETCQQTRLLLSKLAQPFISASVQALAPAARTTTFPFPFFKAASSAQSSGGFFANPQSSYGFFTPNLSGNNATGVRVQITLPSQSQAERLGLLFADLMTTDVQSTETAGSLPSDALGSNGQTPWGTEIVLYMFLAQAKLPEAVVAEVASKRAHLLRWSNRQSGIVPGVIYRLVYSTVSPNTLTAAEIRRLVSTQSGAKFKYL